MLAALALSLAACASSEDLDSPPEDADNKVLGLKVESVQFSTKRPLSKVNPHEETRVGTSFTIPLGLMAPEMMPLGLDQDLEEGLGEADEPSPLENF